MSDPRLQKPRPTAKLVSMSNRFAALPPALPVPLAWRDARHLLILAMLCLPVIGQASGTSGKVSLLFLFVIAVIDAIIGERPSAARPHAWPAARHAWFSGLLYAYAVLHVALIAWGLSLMAAEPSLDEALWLGVSIGFVTGSFGITIAHELGHRAARFDRRLSELLLLSVCYGHFFVEHNRGHHARVGTREDPATARLGESFYRFFPRTVCGSFTHAWRLEALRLAVKSKSGKSGKSGKSAWTLSNRIVIYIAVELALCALAFAAAGAAGLVFFLFQSFVAFTLLELVNYVEHYGLARQPDAQGRPEPVAPHHSWNSDTWFGNALLINLQRHSDHHANSDRPYESLRSIDSAPQLPTGYAGMILMALLPPLWFGVMDRRVRAII